MIVVRLCGGLGNQMFQYATGRAVADVNDTELVLDLDWYRRTPTSNTPREYELARYPIRARLTTARERSIAHFYSGRLFRRLPIVRRPWQLRRERGFDFEVMFTSTAIGRVTSISSELQRSYEMN